jgi:two-component system, OmpR family, sensor histidine kinase CiaH
MVISTAFSTVIYSMANRELVIIENQQTMRWERQQNHMAPFYEDYKRELQRRGLPVPIFPSEEGPDLTWVKEARDRLKTLLGVVNLTILGLSGVGGYFLAGRTLYPIKQMLDEQERFVTDASHEMRTPLTSLRTELEVNLKDRKLKLSDAKKLLESNLEEVLNMQTLSDNLMKLTQYSKKNDTDFKLTKLSEIVDGAVRKVSKLSKNKKIKIVSTFNDFKLEAENQLLTEALVIILENAIKYSFENTKIEIGAIAKRNAATIKITDEGIGIEKNELQHIFDRFYRADTSRTKKTAGYGLGLSIAKEIVGRHGGSILVKSTVGKGSTFIITLPLKQ